MLTKLSASGLEPPPRVALVSVGELFGGVERHLLGLATYLNHRTNNLQVILFHDRELARELRTQGIEPTILHSLHPFDPRLIRRLREILCDHAVEVVHTHGYKATVLVSLGPRPCPFALVKTEHGKIEPTPGEIITWIKSRFYTGLDLWATRTASATVCYVTRDLQSHFKGSHSGLRQQVVYNGISPLSATEYTRPPDYDAGFFHTAIVGRVDVVKGINYAIESLNQPSIPRTIRLNIIGNGPLLKDLQSMAHRLGVADRVRFLGFKPDVYRYLAHADALLLPSLHEGLPYTLLEAMSFGLPIVASRVGGPAEILDHGRTALLVSPKDSAAIADALARLHDDPALAKQLGHAAALEQRQSYDSSHMGATYLNVYKEALTLT